MVAIHDALQSVVKYFGLKKSSLNEDSKINFIQYKVVFGVLIACAILSGLTSWYSRIECASSDFEIVNQRFVEQWCYANSTFIIKNSKNILNLGNHHSAPVDTYVHLRYYQWVTLALVLQAACFQIPRLLWKSLEGGRVQKMVNHVEPADFISEEERSARVSSLAKNYLDRYNRDANKNYFNYFALCQFLYLINALFQIAFTNAFLNYQFLNLFPLWLANGQETNLIFPKAAKCAFSAYSPTGALQQSNVLCVLPMNVLFEKLYICIWVLFAVALCAAIIQNLFVGVALMSTSFFKSGVEELVANNASDWLLLKFLKQNIDTSTFQEFLCEIAERPLKV